MNDPITLQRFAEPSSNTEDLSCDKVVPEPIGPSSLILLSPTDAANGDQMDARIAASLKRDAEVAEEIRWTIFESAHMICDVTSVDAGQRIHDALISARGLDNFDLNARVQFGRLSFRAKCGLVWQCVRIGMWVGNKECLHFGRCSDD